MLKRSQFIFIKKKSACIHVPPFFSGGGLRIVVSTAAFHARVRASVPGLGGLDETKNVYSPSTCVSQYCGERARPQTARARISNPVSGGQCHSSQSSHHPQEVLLGQFSPYVRKGGLKPASFHFFPPFFSYYIACSQSRRLPRRIHYFQYSLHSREIL